MSHMWMSHVPQLIVSCPTGTRTGFEDQESHVSYEWVYHMWMSHVTHMNESHVGRDGVRGAKESMLHMNKSCHTYEWVMSHTDRDGVRGANTHRCRLPRQLSVRVGLQVCCSVLWCVAALQCAAVCCTIISPSRPSGVLQCVVVCCSAAECCSTLHNY